MTVDLFTAFGTMSCEERDSLERWAHDVDSYYQNRRPAIAAVAGAVARSPADVSDAVLALSDADLSAMRADVTERRNRAVLDERADLAVVFNELLCLLTDEGGYRHKTRAELGATTSGPPQHAVARATGAPRLL